MPELAGSLRALLDDGAEQLRQSGVDEPRRQALRIWAEQSRQPAAAAVLEREHQVDPAAAVRFQDAIWRRGRGEPLAYVTGCAGFRHLALVSDARALIPRPETEGLVELLLQRVRSGRVADIGTGTGCIALSLAMEGAYDEVIAVDLSAEALALARRNRDLAGVRLNLVQADLCAPLRQHSVDALISNPPYLTAVEYSSLDASVRDWEPALALVSDGDGMAATVRLLDDGRRVVRPGGWLALETDCSRATAIARHASALGWREVSVHMDLFGRDRYLLAQRSNAR
ncbi:MAG TPA: peptide chain release factor N(5)-glutamine methyltransferase [Gemmatimonadales bacterium]|nr:peptide chain release factor N(5)-glutamine methyltransferase [Gemmatimonadales bacterium]